MLLYEQLGINNDASSRDIRKAFQALALKLHPDKGGDAEKFQKIKEAHDVLIDSRLRQKYDMKINDEQRKNGFFNNRASDRFNTQAYYSGRNDGPFSNRGHKCSDNVTYILSVTLEEIYNGCSRNIQIPRQSYCGNCGIEQTTATSNIYDKCQICGGSGLENCLDGTQYLCKSCKGTGLTLKKSCKYCDGKGIINDTKNVLIIIDKGIEDKHQIILTGEAGSMNPDFLPGDLVVIVSCAEHKFFERKHADLIYKKSISIYEALCGVEFMLHHLSGKMLYFKSNPGEVISTSQVKCFPGHGMPIYSQDNGFVVYGNLYIKFEIFFPPNIDIETQTNMRNCLISKNLIHTNILNPIEDPSHISISKISSNVPDLDAELKNRINANKKVNGSRGSGSGVAMGMSDSNLSDSEEWNFDDYDY